MSKPVSEVLRDKRGIVEGLGVMLIVMTLLVAVGGVVANYAVLSQQASALSMLSSEITNRAEAYAGALNADLETPQVPSTARECSTTTQACTQILSATPNADGSRITLRIQADAVVALSQTTTQDVDIFGSEVTHVTAIDQDARNVWALTNEGLRFRIWGLADGKPKEVSDEDLSNPQAGNSWAVVDDRAGVDSTGDLWAWGPNDIGQAGIGSTSTDPVAPQRVGEDFRFVATEDDRGYAIDSSGRLWVWGKNDRGQLGLGHTDTVTEPTMVTGMAGARFMAVAIGRDNALALTIDGDLRAAGAAQAGFADSAGASWRRLAAGDRYTSVAASTVDGSVVLVSDGLLVGNGIPVSSPSGVRFASVAKGGTASYAISTAGDLYSWGQGPSGELGQGATTSASAATRVPGAPKVVTVQGSLSGALAVTVTGELHYAGKIHLPYEGAASPAQGTTFKRLTSGAAFRQLAGNAGDETFAVKDKDGNLLSVGADTPGLWPMEWLGGNDQLVRMPTPEGFASYTWE